MPQTTIHPVQKRHGRLALGCWVFGGTQWAGQEDADSVAVMEGALERGMNHFDTAQGYGRGRSESVVGAFLKDRGVRETVYLATKRAASSDVDAYVAAIDESLERLKTDYIDLLYIHWPRKGADLARLLEALEKVRSQGKIKAIGVSNFSVEQMEEASKAGTIDAHQTCYNLVWRYPEHDIIPYCREHGIAVVTYSSIAQGILTGKFPKEPSFKEGDHRSRTVMFEPEVWPHVYEGVEQLKGIASDAGRSLTHLAIQWVAAQPGVTSILVGARNASQMEDNATALADPVDATVIDRMSEIGDEVMRHVPDAGNIFRHYP
jgi:aryl-alcohol dehydrogenase-like predicted oxidoreductase